MNVPRNTSEISYETDSIFTSVFFSIGGISLLPNLLTIFLLALHSAFYSTEMRYLLINLQVQTCLQNFHFCILFTPVIFPSLGEMNVNNCCDMSSNRIRLGGGYCNGLLCMAGLPFHYCFTLFLLETVLISSAFIIILFARHQTLIAPDSILKLGRKTRIVFYVITHLVMLSIPILFLSAATPLEEQINYLGSKYLRHLTWLQRGLNWSVIYLPKGDVFISILLGSLYVNIILFGGVMVVLMTHTIWIITRTYKLRSGRRFKGGWQSARIKNTIIVFIQLAIAMALLLAPFAGMVTTVGKGIMAPVIEKVLKLEVVFSLYSLANAIFFIVCNKQYNLWLRTKILCFRRKANIQTLAPPPIDLETTEEPRSPFTIRISPNTLRPPSRLTIGVQ